MIISQVGHPIYTIASLLRLELFFVSKACVWVRVGIVDIRSPILYSSRIKTQFVD